jgi:hypothetical protein
LGTSEEEICYAKHINSRRSFGNWSGGDFLKEDKKILEKNNFYKFN